MFPCLILCALPWRFPKQVVNRARTSWSDQTRGAASDGSKGQQFASATPSRGQQLTPTAPASGQQVTPTTTASENTTEMLLMV